MGDLVCTCFCWGTGSGYESDLISITDGYDSTVMISCVGSSTQIISGSAIASAFGFSAGFDTPKGFAFSTLLGFSSCLTIS